MLLEALFGGGNQSTTPSQQPSSDQSSGSAPTDTDQAAPPTDNTQADPIYDEAPGDTDDGTYEDAPSAEVESDASVNEPAENAAPVEQPSEPSPVTDESPATAPETIADASEPVSGQTGSAESAAQEPGSQTEAQPQPADTPAAALPSGVAPDADEADLGIPGPAPVAVTPIPPAGIPGAAEEAVSANENPETEELRDFITPFLADLEEIRQRQGSGTDDALAESRERAVAAIQDQLADRLVNELSPKEIRDGGPSLLDNTREKAEEPISLVNRWYAEA